ncbi:MAG: ABC transporter ATP-binding protein [Chitinophagaceae bacterium]
MLPLLSIQNLDIAFRSETGINTAVQALSLEVNRGELVAVVGESGSGKSVTSLSILQLLPKANTIYANGKILLAADGTRQDDLLLTADSDLQTLRGNRIAMIFQEPMSSLNPVMTCGHQVMEAILQHRNISKSEAKQQTIELFEKVQLPLPEAMFSRFPHQLSGGQKQRVMIAMAMSCKPDLLICDEPTTALDVTVQNTILQLIKELQVTENIGVIFITHDLSVVGQIADRIMVLYKGRVVETGSTASIFLRPVHPYTKALLACRPGLHPKGQRLPVVSDFMEVSENGEIIEKPVVNSQWSIVNNVIVNQASDIRHQTSKNQPTLTVTSLNVWYPTKTNFLGKTTEYFKAVNDVSFDVFEGETLGLVGESGCGKTTLGRTLLQLIPATSGEIIYEGKNITSLSKNEALELRKHMQIIFQDPYGSLNPRITVGQAIAEPLQVHGMISSEKQRKEKVIEWLEKVNLKAEHYNRYPHEFSGGQRQRIVIARALVMNPKFVVCDESVSALDVSVQAQVLNLLNDLKKEMGFTAIFISHDLGVVNYISDRIMVMQKGRIEEIGLAEEVYRRPQSEYTRQLIEAIPKGYMG